LKPALITGGKPVFKVSLSFAIEVFNNPTAVTVSFAYKHPCPLGTDLINFLTTQLTMSAGLYEALAVFSKHRPFILFS